MTSLSTDPDDMPDHDARPHHPLAIQILSTLLFAAFAIVSTVMAFVWFWPAGVVLAIIMAWRGFGPVWSGPRGVRIEKRITRRLRPDAGPVAARPSGNASFDAYRTDMLKRLEDEQQNFEDFLTRLRAAKDKTEFDHFMDDRARAAAAFPQGESPADAAP